jgi:hypothetical protein
MTKTKRQPPANLKPQAAATPLKTTKVGIRTLVFYDSVLEALGIDPATEPDRPKTVTIKRAIQLIGLGDRHIFRMIAAGRAGAEHSNQDTAA